MSKNQESSENEIIAEIAAITKQLDEFGTENEVTIKLKDSLKKLKDGNQTKEEIQLLIEELEDCIKRLQEEINYPTFSPLEIPLFHESTAWNMSPSVHIEVSEQDGDRVLAREIANILETKSYHTYVRENDFYLRDEITDSTADYDADISLTINIGKEVITVSYFFTLVFKGLVVGIFTKVGRDLYDLVKDKVFTKPKHKKVEPIVFELLLKELDSAARPHKNLRVYLVIKNDSDLENIVDAFKFIEKNAEEFYKTESGKVMIEYKDKSFTWKEINTEDLDLPYKFNLH